MYKRSSLAILELRDVSFLQSAEIESTKFVIVPRLICHHRHSRFDQSVRGLTARDDEVKRADIVNRSTYSFRQGSSSHLVLAAVTEEFDR